MKETVLDIAFPEKKELTFKTGIASTGMFLARLFISYDELTRVFGKAEHPWLSAKEMSPTENWQIKFSDGFYAHIYEHDCLKYDKPVKDIQKWSIGGWRYKSVLNVLDILDAAGADYYFRLTSTGMDGEVHW